MRGLRRGHSVSLGLMAPMSYSLLAIQFPFRGGPHSQVEVPGWWSHLWLSEFSAVLSLITFPYRHL